MEQGLHATRAYAYLGLFNEMEFACTSGLQGKECEFVVFQCKLLVGPDSHLCVLYRECYGRSDQSMSHYLQQHNQQLSYGGLCMQVRYNLSEALVTRSLQVRSTICILLWRNCRQRLRQRNCQLRGTSQLVGLRANSRIGAAMHLQYSMPCQSINNEQLESIDFHE